MCGEQYTGMRRGEVCGLRDHPRVCGEQYTGMRRGEVCGLRDHPRVCGEQFHLLLFATQPTGSSPRVRGTELPAPDQQLLQGIIPACAGNSGFVPYIPTHCRDHPRVCGEQFAYFNLANQYSGSSPRVRGTGQRKSVCVIYDGIIPACAGNRLEKLGRKLSSRDHPRVCGEQR